MRIKVPIKTALGRMVAELLIIVFGVLIALGAQSWWENRGQKEDRLRALDLLRADLVSPGTRALGNTQPDSSLTAIQFLLESGGELGASPDSALNRALVWALYMVSAGGSELSAEESLPVYIDLKGSGRIGLLPEEVRLIIPVIEAQMKGVNYIRALLLDLQTERIDSELIENFRLVEYGSDSRFGVEIPGSEARQLLGTDRLRNLLIIKANLLRSILNRRVQLSAAVEEAVAAIDRGSGPVP